MLFALGGLGALSLAPFFFWPALIPAFSGLFYYLQRSDGMRTAFLRGWSWGFGFFLTGLYWVAISMTVDLARFGWMIPFALLGLNGGLALFPAFACSCYRQVQSSFHFLNLLLFALIFIAFEWLRGHLFTGFPWNLIGYSWAASDAGIQVAGLMDIYTLSFVTIAIASVFALPAYRLIGVIASLAVFISLLGYGYGVLREAAPKPWNPSIPIRLVQANIEQQLKWDPGHLSKALDKHIALSTYDKNKFSEPPLLIWSESAFPYTLLANDPLPQAAFDWMAEEQTLITGAVMRSGTRKNPVLTNSIIALTRRNGEVSITARYDKQHLVPFGEFVPFEDLLPLEKLTAGTVSFTPGEGPRALTTIGSVQFHPLICYEVIFPEYAPPEAQGQAQGIQPVILNLTNDDWFGYSSGPFQHLTMARFRAVEQRMPVIRVANSGISAVIDRYGRIRHRLPLHEQGIIDMQAEP